MALCLSVPGCLLGQDDQRKQLYLQGISQEGVHPYLMENWATLQVSVTNPSAQARDGRVIVFYPGQPDIQYARDVHVPGKSTLSTWLVVGPSPSYQPKPSALDLEVLVYERAVGQDRIVLPPDELRTRSRRLAYRKGERLTCVLLDEASAKREMDPAAPPEIENTNVIDSVRGFRASSGLSEHVLFIHGNFQPPAADAFVGVDHFILAGNSLSADAPGENMLGQWLADGGKLWVMLDLTDPSILGRIVPGRLDIQVVDRTSLTSVRIKSSSPRPSDPEDSDQEFEQPVEFVRVLLAPEYRVIHTVNGWPASFTRSIGRGRLVVTTLAARAWFRTRMENDPPSPLDHFPELPVSMPAMDQLTLEIQKSTEARSPLLTQRAPMIFEPLVTSEVGYEVVGFGMASWIFACFLSSMTILGILVRGSRRFVLPCCLGPAMALASALVFFLLGERSRAEIPPTLAIGQIVHVVPGSQLQPVSGLLALYWPEPSPVLIHSEDGGILDLDMSGLEGQTRRFVMNDIDCWHWENLALPPGLRLAPCRFMAHVERPPTAVVTFGPNGLEGRLDPGPFQGLADAVIAGPTGRVIPVELGSGGTFKLIDGDHPTPSEYVMGNVLTDRQQQRQAVYRQFMRGSDGTEGPGAFLVWADPIEVPFKIEPTIRTSGFALVSIPLELERTPPSKRVMVPSTFIPFRRILNGIPCDPPTEDRFGIEMLLRFQLPREVLPLKVERARLHAQIRAPARQVTLAGRSSTGFVKVLERESPIDPIELDITRQDHLQLDDRGGILVQVAVSDQIGSPDQRELLWKMTSLELEVVGETLSK